MKPATPQGKTFPLSASTPSDNYALVSYERVGQAFGISPARVRQIEQRALGKLRAGLLKQGVTSSLPAAT